MARKIIMSKRLIQEQFWPTRFRIEVERAIESLADSRVRLTDVQSVVMPLFADLLAQFRPGERRPNHPEGLLTRRVAFDVNPVPGKLPWCLCVRFSDPNKPCWEFEFTLLPPLWHAARDSEPQTPDALTSGQRIIEDIRRKLRGRLQNRSDDGEFA